MNDDRTFTIADSFDVTNRMRVNLDAPLPLGYANAIRRALELRSETSMSYGSIATVMRQYHGVDRSTAWWNHTLRVHGADARPRGIMCCGKERVRA